MIDQVFQLKEGPRYSKVLGPPILVRVVNITDDKDKRVLYVPTRDQSPHCPSARVLMKTQDDFLYRYEPATTTTKKSNA